MTRKELKALCEVLWGLEPGPEFRLLAQYANRIVRHMGFENWEEARENL